MISWPVWSVNKELDIDTVIREQDRDLVIDDNEIDNTL